MLRRVSTRQSFYGKIMKFVSYCIAFVFLFVMASTLYALDLGAPRITEPMQQENFFNANKLSFQGDIKAKAPLLEPQLAVSHVAREDEVGRGITQTTHRLLGEAGGKFNFYRDVTFSAVAKIPVYTYGVTGNDNGAGRATGSELLKSAGRLSWRSELGVPLGNGLDLNLFYDRSAIGKIDRPGVDEREERFGTKFIYRFK